MRLARGWVHRWRIYKTEVHKIVSIATVLTSQPCPVLCLHIFTCQRVVGARDELATFGHDSRVEGSGLARTQEGDTWFVWLAIGGGHVAGEVIKISRDFFQPKEEGFTNEGAQC